LREKALILVFLVLAGCSVSRKGKFSAENDLRSNAFNSAGTKSFNLSNSGFFISKATLEISAGGEKQKALCSIKYDGLGKYLVTVRSRTGIEAARLYISNDTVLINDRIDRIVYYGSSEKLSDKYGIAYYLIPLIFGDYISFQYDSEDLPCSDGIIRKRELIYGNTVSYIIDCRHDKVIEAETGRRGELKLRFEDFFVNGIQRYPQVIDIEDTSRRLKVKLTIGTVELPWEGSIEFIPGSNYKKVPII
jgi:hypothetical protein